MQFFNGVQGLMHTHTCVLHAEQLLRSKKVEKRNPCMSDPQKLTKHLAQMASKPKGPNPAKGIDAKGLCSIYNMGMLISKARVMTVMMRPHCLIAWYPALSQTDRPNKSLIDIAGKVR